MLILLLLYVTMAFAQDYVDYSDISSIKIMEPRLAYIDITGIENLPTTKTDSLRAWLEYNDENGVHFKKRVMLNAQGASSLSYPKKNLAIDFCEDEWLGDSTTQITIGNWVKQDAFHLKAYYTDTFRGGLASAAAYKFYDDIVADRDHMLKRAGIEGYSKKALCHPDGFPCIVSLNGEFHGIYAWQLKKHRKNMGMEKDNQQHVWFQIEEYTNSFTTGIVKWEHIDIKNPKVVTDEAKGYITAMAKYNSQLKSLERRLSISQMRNEIEEMFDVESVVDFIIHGLLTSNIDGFGKNVQIFTYDGKRWFVAPYDLDETFGNSWIMKFQFPAEWSFVNDDCQMQNNLKYMPFCWVWKYFREDIEERYAELRKNNTISVSGILAHLQDWNERVGEDNYINEYSRWPKCPTNKTTVVNKNWEYIEDWTEYATTESYDKSKEYQAGDRCLYSYRIFEAKYSVKGKAPLDATGFTDTEDRVEQWLTKRIGLIDDYMNYKPVITSVGYNHESIPTHKKVVVDGTIYIVTDHGTYTIGGQKVRD